MKSLATAIEVCEARCLLTADFVPDIELGTSVRTTQDETHLIEFQIGGGFSVTFAPAGTGSPKGSFSAGTLPGYYKFTPDIGAVGFDRFEASYQPSYGSGGYGGYGPPLVKVKIQVKITFPFGASNDNEYDNPDPATSTEYPTINYFVLKGNTLTVSAANGVLRNDTNPQFISQLTAHQATSGTYGSFSIGSLGDFTYTPNSGVFDDPNFMGLTDTCHYYAEDSMGNKSQVGTVTVALAELFVSTDGIDVSIERSGANVDDERYAQRLLNPWVGEGIALSVGVKGDAKMAGIKYQWSIGSNAIDNYIQAENNAKVIPLSADELKTAGPSFYWYKGGERTVSVTVTAVGQTGADTAQFNVRSPNNHITSITTEVNIFQSEDDAKVRFGRFLTDGREDPASPGIKISYSQDNAASAAGMFSWTQTISAYARAEFLPGVALHLSRSGLDNEIVYAPAVGGLGTSDSPKLELPTGATSVSYCFTADMYLMFRSSRGNSIPVPVETLQWCVSWTAEKSSAGVWSLVSSNWSQNPEGVDSVGFPVWTSILRNGANQPWTPV